jgi:uncharacterized membrane protein YoaK (UPF0700 family)
VKQSERDTLLLMLAAASGSADGWSYFGLAHAFVANMTGNTVLLGIAVFHLHGDVIHPLVALLGYVVGTAAGTLITRHTPEGSVWGRPISWALFAEGALLIGAEAAWVSMRQAPTERAGLVLLGVVALAIGMQSGAMVQLRIPGVVTTYITGTWTTMTHGITLLAARQPKVMRDKPRFEERLLLQGGVLAVYLGSAILTGWCFRHAEAVVGGIPAAAVLLTAAYGALRDSDSAR